MNIAKASNILRGPKRHNTCCLSIKAPRIESEENQNGINSTFIDLFFEHKLHLIIQEMQLCGTFLEMNLVLKRPGL